MVIFSRYRLRCIGKFPFPIPVNRIDQVYRDRGNTWRISPRRIFIKLIRACLIYGNGISYVSYFGIILFFVRSKKAGFFRICEICVEYEEEEEG